MFYHWYITPKDTEKTEKIYKGTYWKSKKSYIVDFQKDEEILEKHIWWNLKKN